MNDDQLADLKQFIDSRISQSEQQIKGDMQEVRNDLRRLEQKMDDGFAGIGDAIEQINEQHDDMSQRFTKLEQRTA